MTNVRSLKTIISELCIHNEDLHHVIFLFGGADDHNVCTRDAFFREPVEAELWLKGLKDQYKALKLPYATWVDGEFTNHGIEIGEEKK